MDLATIEKQMGQSEDRLSAYDANLPSEIESQVKKAGSPLIKESLGVTQDLMSDYLGRFYDITSMGPGMAGTTAKDLSPTQKLGVMGRELGTMSGSLNAAQGYTDYLGGQINDLYGKAVQAAQLGQQNAADEYSRLMQKYQMAWQEAEAEKNRQLQRELAYVNRTPNPTVDTTTTDTTDTQGTDRAANWAQKVQAYAAQRQDPNRPSNYNIDFIHNALLREAQDLGLNIDSEQLWTALGNTPKSQQYKQDPVKKYFDLSSGNYGGLKL